MKAKIIHSIQITLDESEASQHDAVINYALDNAYEESEVLKFAKRYKAVMGAAYDQLMTKWHEG